MKNFGQIFGLLKPYKGYIGANIFFNILSTIFSLFTLAAVAPFLKILFSPDSIDISGPPPEFGLSSDSVLGYANYYFAKFIATNGHKMALAYFCFFIILAFLLKNITRYFTLYFISPVRYGVVRDVRERVHHKVLSLPMSYFSEERKGDLISRMTSDVSEIEISIVSSLEMLFRDPLLIITYLTTLFFLNWQLTLFVCILLPVSGIFISLIAKNLKRTSRKGQAQLGQVLSLFEESLSGLRIIKAFNAEGQKNRHFNQANNRYFTVMVRLLRKQYLSSPLTEVLSTITLALLIYVGGQIVLGAPPDGFTGEFFIMFILIFSQIITPAKSFSDAWFKIQKGLASLERINDILHADNKIKDPEVPVALTEFRESIVFEKASFAYGQYEVLSGIDLEIKKGQTVAFVGASGSGKSTLVNLVPRFYDVSAGAVKIDGIDIRNYKISDIRALLGIVAQDSILFNDTVRNNICLSAPEATDEEVQHAARVANALEFISAMPEGFDTNIGDAGNKLSGGQKQRLSIARAVLKNPPILILDEATSALDTESEQLVQQALNNLMKNRTSLVIAHRLSTIQHADKIVVLEAGKIVETGTHAELLTQEGVYHKLFNMQSFDNS